MFRAFAGIFDSDPWRKTPDGFRDHLKRTLSPQWYSELVNLAHAHGLARRIEVVKHDVWGDHAVLTQALSLACVDALTEIGASTIGLKDPSVKRLANASTALNGESWNPAWAWVFLLRGSGIPRESRSSFVEAALLAYDVADGRYAEFFGTMPARPLVPVELRAYPLLLRLEDDILSGLDEVDRITFSEGMALTSNGVSLKAALEDHFSSNGQPTPAALGLGRRIASHFLYWAATEFRKAANFKSALRYLTCSAAINPRHFLSRFDLAVTLDEMDLALPNAEYRQLALLYAGEALDLVDSVAFDLGPPNEVGEAFGPQREYLGAMVVRLRQVADQVR